MARNLSVFVLLVALSSSAAPPGDVWKRIQKLEGDQKFDAALTLSRAELKDARARHDEAGELRALLETAKLQMGLGEAEGAVTLLLQAPRPKSAVNAAIFDLYEGQAL